MPKIQGDFIHFLFSEDFNFENDGEFDRQVDEMEKNNDIPNEYCNQTTRHLYSALSSERFDSPRYVMPQQGAPAGFDGLEPLSARSIVDYANVKTVTKKRKLRPYHYRTVRLNDTLQTSLHQGSLRQKNYNHVNSKRPPGISSSFAKSETISLFNLEQSNTKEGNKKLSCNLSPVILN